jgi:hypothetical protein
MWHTDTTLNQTLTLHPPFFNIHHFRHQSGKPHDLDYADQLLVSHGEVMRNSHLTAFDHNHDEHDPSHTGVNARGKYISYMYYYIIT